LSNLSDFDPRTDAVAAAEMLEFDQWILLRAEDLVARCRVWYNDFAFHKVYHAVYDFATVDLSSLYFDVLKDRLYTTAAKSHARRSAQTALYRLAYALVRLVAPILTFTAEEVWPHLGQSGSVHLALFPEPAELTEGLSEAHRKRALNWDRLIEVREDVLKSLEEARGEKVIGAPLEARVRLAANGDLYPLLQKYAQELPGLFIVSEVALEEQPGQSVSVKVERAAGAKCERCWKYTTDTGSDPRFPTICAACAGAIDEILHG
jgi:isoleucyl-tRNA synthetase